LIFVIVGLAAELDGISVFVDWWCGKRSAKNCIPYFWLATNVVEVGCPRSKNYFKLFAF
jgi:hypothetical protein